jgi:hypothetical protein
MLSDFWGLIRKKIIGYLLFNQKLALPIEPWQLDDKKLLLKISNVF